jgi:hypothetical protein
MTQANHNYDLYRLQAGVTIVEARLGGWRRMRAGGFVLLLFRLGDAVLRTAGVASAAGINAVYMRRSRSRD